MGGAPAPSADAGVWFREHGLLPTAGLVLSPSVLRPFSLSGLGLTGPPGPHRWRTRTERPPILSRLAVHISDPHMVSITYREYIDDVETPLAHHVFTGPHPAAWIAALARQHHVRLTVTDSAPLLPSATPAIIAHLLHDASTAIIACGPGCVGRSDPPTTSCTRHHLPQELTHVINSASPPTLLGTGISPSRITNRTALPPRPQAIH